ncbi:MAG: ERF family protein [Pedobacter sp.]|jgi:hypothetical protein
MEKSESIINLAKALMAFQMKVAKINKDAVNPFFKSKYASLSNIQEAIYTPLAESGLTYSQLPSGQNGLCTILIHAESGEYFLDTYTMPVAKQNDPQAVGSAITYAKRYALVAMLGLNIDEDDDGNEASKKPKPENKNDDKKWLNPHTPEWNEAVKYLSSDGTIEKIKSKYMISKTNEELLKKAII